MSKEDIRHYLEGAAHAISCDGDPVNFDMESHFLESGCDPAVSELLSDYFPCACGRAFLKEIGVEVSDTYQRKTVNGDYGPQKRFDNDPIWMAVELFVEEIRLDPIQRKKFSLVAQQSAEVDAVNIALNSGQTMRQLAGSRLATVFNSPLKYK